MMIIFACTSPTLIPHWPAYVMTPKCDVTDLTYDVIRVTARDFLALWAVNIQARCLKDTFSNAELHGEHVGEGFMSLSYIVFLIFACKVEKVPISRKFYLWPAITRSNVDLGSKIWTPSCSTRRCAYARFFPRSSTTFRFETPGGGRYDPPPGCPCYEKWPGCARVKR